jgi:multidrug efflux pump subunit AcrA (membrane-fusion protein)
MSSAHPGQASADSSSHSSADTVKIAEADQKRAGIQIAAVVTKSMPRTLAASGQVAMDEKHTNHIGALADGRVESVLVLPGDTVRRGQTLATIHSHTVHETVAALTQAYAAMDRQKSAITFATQRRDRYARLYEIQAASLEEKQRSEQDLLQVQKDLTDAQATLVAEREHLAEILQVSPESLQPGTLYQRELVPVRSPADGVLIARNITVGQVVVTGDELFVVTNLSTIWVNAAVNEKDVSLMRIGRGATVAQQSSSAFQLSGVVTMIGDVVDPQTRTLPVRILVSNHQSTLRPGMFVTASISEPDTNNSVFVPQDALQDINGFKVVFTTSDGVTFHATAVRTGAQSGNLIEIVDGLKPTDRVVVNGAFMVKGEMLKGSVGED